MFKNGKNWKKMTLLLFARAPFFQNCLWYRRFLGISYFFLPSIELSQKDKYLDLRSPLLWIYWILNFRSLATRDQRLRSPDLYGTTNFFDVYLTDLQRTTNFLALFYQRLFSTKISSIPVPLPINFDWSLRKKDT